MSTKIYTAWRFKDKEGRLAEFVEKLEDRVFELTAEEVKDITARTVPLDIARDDLKPYVENGRLKRIEKEDIEIARLARFFTGAIETSERESRWFNLDCWANLWPCEGYWYVHPGISDLIGKKLKMLEQIDWLEDFCYWNNVDMPEDLTVEEWDKRGYIWDQIMEDRFSRRLSLTMIEAKNPWNIGLDRIEKEITNGYRIGGELTAVGLASYKATEKLCAEHKRQSK